MPEPIDSRLIYDILKDVQARLAHLEGMRDEVREGFASIRAHMATQHGDAAFLERRVIERERDRERVKAAGQAEPVHQHHRQRRRELVDESEKA